MSNARSFAPLALTAALGLLAAVPASAQHYSITDLGILPTGLFSYANAVNAGGQVAGQSNSGGYNGEQQATLYSGGALSSLNAAQSNALGINDSGQVTGLAVTSAPGAVTVNQAFVYSNGATTYLPSLGGAFSEGTSINNSAQVVGLSSAADNSLHAFLYSNFTLTDLDPIISQYNDANFGGSGQINDTVANSISNNGKITGSYYNNYAYTYDSKTGTVAFLPSLQHSDPADTNNYGGGSIGDAINDAGQVAGYNYTADGGTHAVLYSSTGALTDLTPGQAANFESYAQGINSKGQVVGEITGATDMAFLYSGGKLTDLNTLIDPSSGWQLEFAEGINDSGQIAGYGFYQGHVQGYLLTLAAAPEPSQFAGLALGALGLGGLMLKARRRKSQAA